MLSLVVARGVFAVFSNFVLKHTVAICFSFHPVPIDIPYHQDAAMSENSVYMGHSDAMTSKFAEKVAQFQFHPASGVSVWVAANFCSHWRLDANRSI